jgi:hypothetical protein
MTNAFEYVTEVLEIVQEEDEARDVFLQRVAFQIQNLPESGWNDLPTELQDWYNKTADMLTDSESEVEFTDIPGSVETKKSEVKKVKAKAHKPPKAVKKAEIEVEEGEEETEEAEEGEEETEEKPEPKKRGRKPSSEPKPPKAPKEPKGPIAANAVREIMCEDMSTSLDQLMVKLEERGVVMQRSSAQVVHLNTVRAFEVAIQMGTVSNAGTVVLTTA